MYDFHQINHPNILTYSILVGLTPLIPIPFLDDIVKSEFQRRMVRQIAAARGQQPTPAQVDAVLEEDFFRGCIGGCAYALLYYPVKEILSKLFFIVEWRRAFNLVSATYYTGFLLDAALMDGYSMDAPRENTAQAKRLRLAIERTRQGANYELIKHVVREHLNPLLLLRAAWQLIHATVPRVPAILTAIPGAIGQGIRSAPGVFWRGFTGIPRRIRANIRTRIHVLLGRERAPEFIIIERVVQDIQKALLTMPTDHFDALRARLMEQLSGAIDQSPRLSAPLENDQAA